MVPVSLRVVEAVSAILELCVLFPVRPCHVCHVRSGWPVGYAT